MAQASSFLKKKAAERKKVLEEKNGASTQGGSVPQASTKTKNSLNTPLGGGQSGAPSTRASDFLRKRAEERATIIDKQYGSGAYGGTEWREPDKVAGFNSWLSDVASLSEQLSNDYNARQGQYQSEADFETYRAENSVAIARLINRGNTYRTYFNDNAAMFDPETLASAQDVLAQYGDYLNVAQGNLDNEQAFWSQFADEIEYTGYLREKEYTAIPQAEDFAENSQYVPTGNGEAKLNILATLLTGENGGVVYDDPGYDDLLYEWINGNEKAGDIIRNNDANMYDTGSGALGRVWAYATEGEQQARQLTKEEIGIFNYIYATEGKDAAYQYYDYMQKELNYRNRAADEAYWAEQAAENPFGSSLFSVVMSPAKGMSYLMQAADYIGSGEIDQNAPYNKFSYIPTAIRTEVSGIVEKNWGGIGSFAYNTGMSMGDFLFTTAVSGGNQALSLAIMGTGAAADTTIAAKDRGLSDGQAFALGTVAGAAEVAMEKLSLDKLFDLKTLGESSLRYVLQNTLTEGGEEVGTELINTLADFVIAQDQSEWNASINAYMAQGMSQDEATNQTLKDKALEFGLAGLGGMISGGLVSGGGVAINTIGNRLQNTNTPAAEQVPPEAADIPTEAPADTQAATPTISPDSMTNGDIAAELVNAGATQAEAETLAPLLSAVLNGEEISGNQAGTIAKNEVAVSILENATGETINTDAPLGEVKATIRRLASRATEAQATKQTVDTPAQAKPAEAAQAPVEPSVMESPAMEDFAWHNAQAVADFAKTVDKAGATVLTQMYSEGQDTEQYIAGMMKAYHAGMTGSTLDSVRLTAGKNGGLAGVTSQQAEAAYMAGQADAKTSLAKQQRAAQYAKVAGTDSGLVFDDYVADTLNVTTAERVNSVAKLLGLRVRFVDSVRGGTANAQISGSEVLVERNNPNPVMFLLGHEWTHRLQELAPTEYRAFRNAVAEEVQGEALDLLEYYRRAGEDISYEEALDEAAANYAGRMIEDSTLLDQFIEKHKDNRTMLEKVRDAIRTLISKLTGAERRAAQTAEGKLTVALEAAAVQAGTLQANVDSGTIDAARNSLKEDLENGRARKETREDFKRRCTAEGYSVYEGKGTAYGYRAVHLQSAQQNARQVQEEIRKLGIVADIIDGAFWWNRDGITGVRPVPEAATVDRARILINNGVTLPPRNVAGHEAFHLRKSGVGREAFIEAVEDNLLFTSEDFRYYQSVVAEIYLGQEADLSDPKQEAKFMEELFACISGDIHEGVNDDLLRPMFRDFDAVKAAWNELVAQNGGKARYSIKEYSAQEKKDHANAALEFFGRTYSWKETGYLTQDGKKIDFSGKHEGGPGGYRTVDHRDIRDALGEDYGGDDYSGSMVQFMAEGNIRIMPESDGINLSVVPTKAQEQALDDFISRVRGEVILDIDAPGGDSVVSVEYPRGTRASKVLADIRQYFEDGTQPYVSEVSKFRYSLKRATSSEIASAEKMENEGATREDIWVELGVIRDAAGNWVSEIDDTQMKYHRGGDARFTQAHPEYAEYQSLMQKMFYGSLTDEEHERIKRLDGMWGREIGRLSERVDRGNATLEDILEFNELFSAYPQLRNVKVRFDDLSGTRELASFNQRSNIITLDESLRSSPESTLLHEIQHAIQHLEKRPTGASIEYWQNRMTAGETFREHDTEITQARRRMDAAWDKMPEELKNRVREINRESIRAKETGNYDRLTELQDAMFNSEDGDLYAEYDNALWEIRLYSENNTPMSAEDLYYRTAGEIEARLVQQRRRMTAEERRANMPDLGWDRAVFSRNDPRNHSLKGSESSEAMERYKALIDKYGAIPTGENPARDVQVPKKTAEHQKVSQTVRTILEAKATPDVAVPTIEELTANGDFSYEVYTDKQAMGDAENIVRDKGYNSALMDWTKSVQEGEVSKANTALGWALYNQAANAGDLKTAMSILTNMVSHQRNAAQAVQATRILKKMSPEAQLYGVQRSAQNLAEELEKRYGKDAPDIQVNEELARKYLEAETDKEREEAMRNLYRDLGRQMPSRFIDKWNAWRYLSMLGNPRTHVRNVLGNAFFAPVVAAKNMTATAIEAAVSRVSGGKLDRTKGAVGVGKQGRELLSAAWSDYESVADQVSSGGKYSDLDHSNQYIQEGRHIFKTRALEAARKGNSAALEAEDMWFSRPHYAYALAQYCKANGITAEQMRNGKGLDRARAYAIKEAQKATYRDTNAFSQTISELGRYRGNNKVKKGVGVALEGILPFRKTPANILVRGLEYSPLGLANGIKQAAWDVKRGNKTAAEAIDSISAGLTGTGLLALGAFLAAQGLVRGSGGDDEEKSEFEELQGHQAYALELPDGTSVTLDWLAPEVLPFFVGVNLWEQTASKGDGGVTMSDILTATANVTEPLLEMSCLQSLNDVFDAVGYASSDGLSALPSALASAATSYLTQGFPTILGQAERTGEDRRMTTYTEKNAFLTPDMQYTVGRISARLPGWDYQQIPYIDAWGRTESTGNAAERAGNNFLNPAYTSTVATSPMEDELLRLYEQTGDGSVLPSRAAKYFNVDGKRKDLTAQEYVKYAQAKGQTAYKVLTALSSTEAYRNMSDAEKVETVGLVYDYANATAKTKVSGYKPEGWIAKAVKTEKATGLKAEQYVTLYLAQKGIESLKEADGDTITNSKSLLVMEMVYNVKGLTDAQRRALFEDFGVGKTVIHFNKAAVQEKLKTMR